MLMDSLMIAKLDRLKRPGGNVQNSYELVISMLENMFPFKKESRKAKISRRRVYSSLVRLAIVRSMQEDEDVDAALLQVLKSFETNSRCGECYLVAGHNCRDLGYLEDATTYYVTAIKHLSAENGSGSVGEPTLAGISVMGTDSFASGTGEKAMRSIVERSPSTELPLSTARAAARHSLAAAYASLGSLYHEVGAYDVAKAAYKEALSHRRKPFPFPDFALAALEGDSAKGAHTRARGVCRVSL